MSAFVLTAGAARASQTLSANKVLVNAARHSRDVQMQRHVNPHLIRRYRARTWRWQALTGAPVRTLDQAEHQGRPAVLGASGWTRLSQGDQSAAQGRVACIHRYEGSWRDSGDPYWGGLQMDRGFMAGYAPRYLLRRGFADHWSPLEQMWVAERAYRSGRGF
jgi:hypothetical protein